MTFKVIDNQYGWPHPSDNWVSCYQKPFVSVLRRRAPFTFLLFKAYRGCPDSRGSKQWRPTWVHWILA